MPKVAREITRFKSQEVKALFKKARRVLQHAGLDMICAPATKSFGRILIVTPRHIGPAVQRNKIKRRLRSIFYESQLFNYGYDCIILVRADALQLHFFQLKHLVTQAFKNIKEKISSKPERIA